MEQTKSLKTTTSKEAHNGRELWEVTDSLRLQHEQFLRRLDDQFATFIEGRVEHACLVPSGPTAAETTSPSPSPKCDQSTISHDEMPAHPMRPDRPTSDEMPTHPFGPDQSTSTSAYSPKAADPCSSPESSTYRSQSRLPAYMSHKPSFAKRREKDMALAEGEKEVKKGPLALKEEIMKSWADQFEGPVRRRSREDVFQQDDDCKGRFKRFAMSSKFDYISAFLVISNAAFIGAQVDQMGSASSSIAFRVIEYAFCVAFLIELGLRLYAQGCNGYFVLNDTAWNWFDFVIVSLSTVDAVISIILDQRGSPLGHISFLRVVRIIRITRVLRIIRVMRFFKDLRILISAITSTLKTAFWALILLVIAMYMFGVAIAQMTADHVKMNRDLHTPLTEDASLLQYFGSLGSAIWTLFMTVAGGIDWEHASDPLSELPLALCIYVLFILFSSFCMMNVVTGIFVQNAMEIYEADKGKVIESQLKLKDAYVSTLTEIFMQVDASGDGKCSKEEFEDLCYDQHMRGLLQTLDIEPRDALALFTIMDPTGTGELDLDEFIHGCITLRGQAKAVHMERAMIEHRKAMAMIDQTNNELTNLCVSVNAKLGGKSFSSSLGDENSHEKTGVRRAGSQVKAEQMPSPPHTGIAMALPPCAPQEVLPDLSPNDRMTNLTTLQSQNED